VKKALNFLPPLAGVALGLVFLAAAAAKGADLAAFEEQVVSYGIVGGILAKAVAWSLVPLEALLGAALLVGYRRRLAAAAIGLLLVFFIGVSAWAWATGKTGGCGCFGSLESRTPQQVIEEDLGLLALAVVALFPLFPAASRPAGSPGTTGALNLARKLVVVSFCLGAVAYQFAAPGLPIDNYVTALRPGREVADLGLILGPEHPEGWNGSKLVALIDMKSDSAGATVAALNDLGGKPGVPPIVAFAAGNEADRGEFFWKYGPRFQLEESTADALRPLYRKLPRFFLVHDGRVKRTWNESFPTVEDLFGGSAEFD
jgi:uncharacterized membrane protein YphA (DoxX/SURF4 family)